jgi:predicted nucleotidyltransferase
MRVIVGSQAYGLAHAGSDVDRMAVAVLPTEDILGLLKTPETDVQHDPFDMQTHEVGKFVRLALKCNPTILETLWLDEKFIEEITWVGEDLRHLRESFLSRKAVASAYAGYASQQLHRLIKRDSVRREKHARHIWRLMHQGKQLLETGSMRVTLSPDEVQVCREFSELPDDQLGRTFAKMEESLTLSAERSSTLIPREPNVPLINNWLVNVRKEVLLGS